MNGKQACVCSLMLQQRRPVAVLRTVPVIQLLTFLMDCGLEFQSFIQFSSLITFPHLVMRNFVSNVLKVVAFI